MDQQYHSLLLNKAVAEVSKLPGIGRKTALRLVLHLLRCTDEDVEQLASSLTELKHEVRYCRICHNISDSDVCPICSNPKRDTTTVCVVENIQDLMAIDNTMQYNGLYHVLGGLISPMEGVGPQDIESESLCQRVGKGNIREVIFALSSTMEGDTTAFYLYRKLVNMGAEITMSAIAKGISVGNELEYTDEITLGKSIKNRTAYNGK